MKNLVAVKSIFKSKFEMKDLRPAKMILRMKINRDRKNKILSQNSYISKVLKRFGMDNLKPTSTPIG